MLSAAAASRFRRHAANAATHKAQRISFPRPTTKRRRYTYAMSAHATSFRPCWLHAGRIFDAVALHDIIYGQLISSVLATYFHFIVSISAFHFAAFVDNGR